MLRPRKNRRDVAPCKGPVGTGSLGVGSPLSCAGNGLIRMGFLTVNISSKLPLLLERNGQFYVLRLVISGYVCKGVWGEICI